MKSDDPRHGTYAGGRLHRNSDERPCDPCAHAEARYEQARQLDILSGRPRSIDGIGTQRRLQALAALGHTFPRIGDALGMTASGAHHLATRDKAYVRAATAAKVVALYDAWSMTLPTERTSTERRVASYARTVATKRSWATPLAWEGIDIDDPNAHPDRGTRSPRHPDDVDEVLVDRILDGDFTLASSATTAERHLVTMGWTARGRPTNELARATGWRPDRYAKPHQDAAA